VTGSRPVQHRLDELPDGSVAPARDSGASSAPGRRRPGVPARGA
jgi:hypothetical protein